MDVRVAPDGADAGAAGDGADELPVMPGLTREDSLQKELGPQLITACERGDDGLVAALLGAGAHPVTGLRTKWTPLHAAAASGSSRCVMCVASSCASLAPYAALASSRRCSHKRQCRKLSTKALLSPNLTPSCVCVAQDTAE